MSHPCDWLTACGAHNAVKTRPLSTFHGTGTPSPAGSCYCKPCHNARERETRQRLYGGSRHYHLKKRYGIGAAEVDALIAAQGGLGAACKERPATQVDHDHRTGKVRGMLCMNCKAALGALEDDLQTIYKAICYLEPIPMGQLAE